MAGEQSFEIIVVGGGPAGSTLAWDLARKGIRTLLLERARFPREKVCGDYVDPRGLEILEALGCLEPLARSARLPITHTTAYVDWEHRYRGPVPFYGFSDRLLPHGYAISREELDATMLQAAVSAGATVHEQTSVAEVVTGLTGVELTAERHGVRVRYRAKLIAGADGVNSIVAQSQGLTMLDPRRTAIAQRAYAAVSGCDGESGEAEFFYDDKSFPGYGWMFPAGRGRVNLGVGLLAETRARGGVHLPELFSRFLERLRRHHPRCADIELVSKPIGGVVKMYGGAGRNHFDGGVLIGDAGCFVDPVTGEGIAPGMESALLAGSVLAGALADGDFRASRLAAYEAAFRAYFDPSMLFLDLCASMFRNPHLVRPSLKALARAFRVAEKDGLFARTCGSYFGGFEIRPFAMLGLAWLRASEEALLAWPRLLFGADGERLSHAETSPSDLLEWQTSLLRSTLSDPRWHLAWTLDVQRQWARVLEATRETGGDPRAQGLLGR
jgi:geranylgeranyl reductase family protein